MPPRPRTQPRLEVIWKPAHIKAKCSKDEIKAALIKWGADLPAEEQMANMSKMDWVHYLHNVQVRWAADQDERLAPSTTDKDQTERLDGEEHAMHQDPPFDNDIGSSNFVSGMNDETSAANLYELIRRQLTFQHFIVVEQLRPNVKTRCAEVLKGDGPLNQGHDEAGVPGHELQGLLANLHTYGPEYEVPGLELSTLNRLCTVLMIQPQEQLIPDWFAAEQITDILHTICDVKRKDVEMVWEREKLSQIWYHHRK